MRGSTFWRWRKPSAGLALTENAVVAFSNGGAPRYRRQEVPPGLVAVSATAPNVKSVGEFAQIVEATLDAVGALGEQVTLALPDLALTTALFPGRSRASTRELRRELGELLPYDLGEARCDFWKGRYGEVLAASVREVVARQYEQIVEALDCRLAWVDAVSLATIPNRSERPARPGELDVDLQLYRGHYCMTVFRGGELVDVRFKLRTEGDVELVCGEVLRAPVLHGPSEPDDDRSIDALSLIGVDAPSVAAVLEESSRVRSLRIESDDEDALLRSSIETVLARGNV